MRRRLITIPISHYCERARWALQRCKVTFEEEQHLQMIHWRVTRPRGSTTVPMLIANDQVLRDSADIVRYANSEASPEDQLYPKDAALRDEITRFEQRFAGQFGIEVRRLVYHHFFAWGRPALPFNRAQAPGWQALLLQLSFPLARAYMRRALNVSPQTADRARERLRPFLDEVAGRLSDGRPYLFGERFSAADLTFAALCAPLVLPRNYGVALPSMDALPGEMRAEVAQFRDHPAGAHALRTYADER